MSIGSISRRLFLGGALAASCTPGYAASLSIDRLIARNTSARGGARRLNALRSMASVVRVTEPSFSVVGRYLADARGFVRVDVYSEGKRVFSEGVDAEGVWELGGDSNSPKGGSEKGKQALLHGVEFNLIGLNRMAGRGHRLALATPPLDAGRHAMQLTLSDGFETILLVSPENWQVVARRDQRAYHVDVDPTVKRIESRFSDFRKQGGVVTPFRSEDVDLDSGKQVGRTETLQLAWNVETSVSMPRGAASLPAPSV